MTERAVKMKCISKKTEMIKIHTTEFEYESFEERILHMEDMKSKGYEVVKCINKSDSAFFGVVYKKEI